MENLEARLGALGVGIPEVLIPAAHVDLGIWAVVACDQYTQDREYWASVEEKVGEAPSSLRIVYPEIFLEDGDRQGRIAAIKANMSAYLRSGVFAAPVRAPIYIERSSPFHPKRRGLLVTIDLDRYEWKSEARSLIRATEGTVETRIPPRMEIRRDARLESPHIMLLIDDERKNLIEKVEILAKANPALYTSSLMMDSGTVTGWPCVGIEIAEHIARELERLAERASIRYQASEEEDPFLFAVGDGNHSLATAKAIWEEYKAAHRSDPDLENHPARWALVEIVNLYDEGLEFEPIHRVVFGTTLEAVESVLKTLPGASVEREPNQESLREALEEGSPNDGARYGLVAGNACLLVRTRYIGLATDPLQTALDRFIAATPGTSIDYTHGTDETIKIGASGRAVAVLLPPVRKESLFATVARTGPLPRKSFSMGESCEKRFYLECRRLFE